MKAEQAKEMTDAALARLSEALEQGRSEELTRFLAAVAKFHRYSFGNVMLILSQKPDATRVAGFNTWRSLNRFVKKGEKGIVVIAPMMLKSRDDEPNVQRETILRFRAVHVFDISQTDGEPFHELRSFSGEPGVYSERLRSFIASCGVQLRFEESLGGADGSSQGGTIVVRAGLPAAEEFSVLVHELAHEMMHHGDGAVRGSKTERETEAEAVAFVVSTAIGIDCGTSSSDYIQLYRGDKKTLASSLDRIQKTAAEILQALTD